MTIRQACETINQMAADSVIDRYATGGAVGATFYLEPVATLDMGAFVALVQSWDASWSVDSPCLSI
ncbi:MAG: hypothetical protein LH624_04245 [Cryobacterium sp.]|nr:hypothetical protein [Cryobacterium sp.]